MDEQPKNKIYYILRYIVIILLVVGGGLLAVNQLLQFKFNAEFLSNPCQVCKDLNENQSDCITGCFAINMKIYQDQFGNWKDAQGNCWNTGGEQTTCKGFVGANLFNISLADVS